MFLFPFLATRPSLAIFPILSEKILHVHKMWQLYLCSKCIPTVVGIYCRGVRKLFYFRQKNQKPSTHRTTEDFTLSRRFNKNSLASLSGKMATGLSSGCTQVNDSTKKLPVVQRIPGFRLKIKTRKHSSSFTHLWQIKLHTIRRTSSGSVQPLTGMLLRCFENHQFIQY